MKRFRWAAIVIALSLVAAACTGGDADTTTTEADGGPDTTEAPDTGAKKEVRYLIQETDPPSVEAYILMEAEFEEEFPQYDVVIEFTNPDAVPVKIASVIAAGGVLDVFQPSPPTAVELARGGNILAVDDIVDNLGGTEEFFPNMLLQVDGTTYCIPYATGGPVLWYRTDLFEAAGLEPPTTWEEMEAAAATLNTADIAGVIVPGGDNNFTSILTQVFMWQAGTQVFDVDGNIGLAGNERAAEALTYYAALLESAPEAALSYSFFESLDAFTAGKGAMLVYWGRTLGRLYSNAPDLIGKVKAVPLPSNRMQVTFLDNSNNCIYSETENPEGAKAWLEFMGRPEQAVKLQLTIPGHLAPVTFGQRELLLASDNEPLKENPETAEVLFDVPNYGYVVNLHRGGIDEENLTVVDTGVLHAELDTLWSSTVLALAVQNVFFEGMDVAQALEEAQTALEEAVEAAS